MFSASTVLAGAVNVLTALAGSDGGRSGESGNHRAGRVCAVCPDCDHRGGACDVYINRRNCVTCGISPRCELRAYNICGKSCSFWRITNQRRGLGMCFGAKQRQTQQLQQQGGEGPRGSAPAAPPASSAVPASRGRASNAEARAKPGRRRLERQRPPPDRPVSEQAATGALLRLYQLAALSPLSSP